MLIFSNDVIEWFDRTLLVRSRGATMHQSRVTVVTVMVTNGRGPGVEMLQCTNVELLQWPLALARWPWPRVEVLQSTYMLTTSVISDNYRVCISVDLLRGSIKRLYVSAFKKAASLRVQRVLALHPKAASLRVQRVLALHPTYGSAFYGCWPPRRAGQGSAGVHTLGTFEYVGK